MSNFKPFYEKKWLPSTGERGILLKRAGGGRKEVMTPKAISNRLFQHLVQESKGVLFANFTSNLLK